MSRRTIIALSSALALGVACSLAWGTRTLTVAHAAPPKWENAPKGMVSGTLTFSRRRPKQPIVVYLERLGEPLEYSPPRAALEIHQRGARFTPGFAVVVPSQEVVFLNDERREIDHNVYTVGAETIDLGIFSKDVRRSYRFNTPGEVALHCSVHRLMDGKLFVAPNPAYAVVGRSGTEFTIADVPVGKYVLKTYQKAKRFHDASLEIAVTAGMTTQVHVELSR